MQINLNLPPDLEQDLLRQAAQSNVSLQTFILQALRQMIHPQSVPGSQWPESVLSFEGVPDFPRFEAGRDDLLPPAESGLF